MAKKPKGSVSGGSGSPEKKSGKKGQETTDEDQQQSNKVSEVCHHDNITHFLKLTTHKPMCAI